MPGTYSGFYMHKQFEVGRVVTCGAHGADSLARKWAFEHNIEAIECVANWKVDGRAAGPTRNGLMIEQEQSDVVVALTGGRGTGDLVKRAKDRQIRVFQVN